jgi:hypothetical protein
MIFIIRICFNVLKDCRWVRFLMMVHYVREIYGVSESFNKGYIRVHVYYNAIGFRFIMWG